MHWQSLEGCTDEHGPHQMDYNTSYVATGGECSLDAACSMANLHSPPLRLICERNAVERLVEWL